MLLSTLPNVELHTEGGGIPFRAACRGCHKIWRANSSPEDYPTWLNGHRTHQEEYKRRA